MNRYARIASGMMALGAGLALFAIYYWQVSIPIFEGYAERVSNARQMFAGGAVLVALGAIARRAVRDRAKKDPAQLGEGAAPDFAAKASHGQTSARRDAR